MPCKTFEPEVEVVLAKLIQSFDESHLGPLIQTHLPDSDDQKYADEALKAGKKGKAKGTELLGARSNVVTHHFD